MNWLQLHANKWMVLRNVVLEEKQVSDSSIYKQFRNRKCKQGIFKDNSEVKLSGKERMLSSE